MTGFPLKVWPEAEADFAEAGEWYESKEAGLAFDFGEEVDRTLQKIILNPFLFPVVDRGFGIRRALTARFPFKIFFVVREESIEICAILHASKDAWIVQRRLQGPAS